MRTKSLRVINLADMFVQNLSGSFLRVTSVHLVNTPSNNTWSVFEFPPVQAIFIFHIETTDADIDNS